MSDWLTRRRLTGVSSRLRALRDELGVLQAQLPYLADDADDARTRAIVAERSYEAAEYRETQRHADAQSARKAKLVTEIAAVERRQDELLDHLNASRRRSQPNQAPPPAGAPSPYEGGQP